MLAINTDTYLIEITRGDSVSITFSAADKDGNVWNPEETTDKLTFAVVKKWGAEPLMEKTNTYDGDPYTEVEIDEDTFNANKTEFYTESGGTYTQCKATDSYNSSATYYVKDYAKFWTIVINKTDWINDAGEDKFKFTDYLYDVQLTTESGADTIIGKTDDITPTFRVWGEAANE